MISFYTVFKIFFLKPDIVSDARVASITKNDFGLTVHFYLLLIFSNVSTNNDALNDFGLTVHFYLLLIFSNVSTNNDALL